MLDTVEEESEDETMDEKQRGNRGEAAVFVMEVIKAAAGNSMRGINDDRKT